MKNQEGSRLNATPDRRHPPATYESTASGLRIARTTAIPPTPTDKQYPIPESRYSQRIAAVTAASLGGVTIERADKNTGIHPDAIHAKVAYFALRSVLSEAPEIQRLRPFTAEELMSRPLRYVALDNTRSGEDAQAGAVFVKPPLGPELHAEISTMYVDDDHTGQGVSGRLINRATVDTLLAGWTPFALAANEHAQRAFLTAGYDQVPLDQVPTPPYNTAAAAFVMHPASPEAETLLSHYIDGTEFDAEAQRIQMTEYLSA